MTETIDFSIPHVEYSPNANGEWPHALERAISWTETKTHASLPEMPNTQCDCNTLLTQPLEVLTGAETKKEIRTWHASRALQGIPENP